MLYIIHYKNNACVLEVSYFKWKYKKVGVLSIRIVKSNVSSVGPSSERKLQHYVYFKC